VDKCLQFHVVAMMLVHNCDTNIGSKAIKLSTSLPTALTNGQLDNVIMGDNSVSVGFKKTSNTTTYTITQRADDWTILFEQPTGKYKRWMLNGKRIKPIQKDDILYICTANGSAKITLTN